MENKNTTRYAYHDANGNELYTKIRVEENGSKTFYFDRLENGVIVTNINNCKKVLYQLSAVLHAIKYNLIVFLVEGEKDVHTLLKHSHVATTAHSTSFWYESFTEALQNADVIILYDYDKAGIDRRNMLCEQLYGRVKRLRVVDLPGLEYREKHGLD